MSMNFHAHRLGALLAFAFLCSCGGGGGGGGAGNGVPPPASAVTLSFSTTAGVVSMGQSIPLSWTSTGSTCTAQGDWSGTQSATGSAQLTVNQSSVFKLTCSNGANSASASLRIEVVGTSSRTTSTVAYSATGLSTLNYVILPIDVLEQVYDPANGLIHAYTSATSSSYPQSLVSIDPVTARVVASTPLSMAPWALAVSADGQYLYVMSTVKGSPIQRYKVSGLVPDLSIPLSGTGYAQGVSVSSASPTIIAVTSTVVVGNNPQQWQLQIFDGATPRANSYLAPVSVTLLSPVWTADNAGVVVPGGGINVFAVDAQGVSLSKVVPVGGPFNGSLHANIFYDNDGNVIDTAGPVALLGQMADHGKPISSQYVENPAIDKSFTLESDSFQNRYLTSYSATQFYAIDSVQVPLANGLSGPSGGSMTLWGSDGIAWGEGGSLVIAHGSFAQAGGSLPPIQSLPVIAGGSLVSAKNSGATYAMYDIAANDIAADSCGNLHVAISDGATNFPNSVVTLDPILGSVTASKYAASQPAILAVADDCTAIYAGVLNSNSVVRLGLPALTSTTIIPLTQAPPPAGSSQLPFAQSISVAPGTADTIAVTLNFHGWLCNSQDYGLAVYDGGTRRPNVFTSQSGPKAVAWGKDTSTLYEEDWDGIKSLTVDATGAGQPTLLVPYATLEGNTDIYDLSTNLYFDPAKSRVLSGDGAAYDVVAATSAKLPVHPVINGNGCNLFGAVTTDRHTGKIFYAQLNTNDDAISVISFDSLSLSQSDQIRIPKPSGMVTMGGPTRLVRLDATSVALVTNLGYVVALNGGMFAQ
jgi:hypothetical protein